MRPVIRKHCLAAGFLLLAAGCAPLAPAPPAAGHYVCDGGKGFHLQARGEQAEIEIDGMRFGLHAEPAADGGSDYACSMLALRRAGDGLQVEMEGRPYLKDCRPR